MGLLDAAQFWHVTPDEIAAGYPAHRHAVAPYRTFLRAVDVAAPPAVVFRWLCQLKAAPYSYDWLDNLGRRSPRVLTPGLASRNSLRRWSRVSIRLPACAVAAG